MVICNSKILPEYIVRKLMPVNSNRFYVGKPCHKVFHNKKALMLIRALCPGLESNADATVSILTSRLLSRDLQYQHYWYFCINALSLSLERFFNFFSNSMASDLVGFSVNHFNCQGLYRSVAFSLPLLCRSKRAFTSFVCPM